MALTFPLPLADFFQGIPVQSVEPDLPDALSMSRTQGGGVATDDIGERLWTATATLVPGYPAQQQAIRAKLNILRESGRSLMVSSVENPYPFADPDGSILGAASPVIGGLEANNRELAIDSLPAGYHISDGDFIGFQYGSDPVRFAYHMVGTGSVASAGGLTGLIEVTPHIRPGAIVGASVSLIRPAFKAILVPGSVRYGRYQGKTISGISFSVIQTLR